MGKPYDLGLTRL